MEIGNGSDGSLFCFPQLSHSSNNQEVWRCWTCLEFWLSGI